MYDLSLKDLQILKELAAFESIHETARRRGMSPSAVSKVLKRSEGVLQAKLFDRTPLGLAMRSDSMNLLQRIEEILEIALSMHAPNTKEQVYTIGGITFLVQYLATPPVSSATWKLERFRFVGFSHNQLVQLGIASAFDLCLHIGPLHWPETWHSEEIGKITWNLYGAKETYAHKRELSAAEVKKIPFIVPTDWNGKGFVSGSDLCPLALDMRLAGHEAPTAEAALEVVANSGNVTFVPDVVANSPLFRDRVQKVVVKDWPEVQRSIVLTVHQERVPARLLTKIKQVIRGYIANH